MDLYVLFMQRRENYEGEYGPEALACIDEFTLHDGGDQWWRDEVAKKKKQNADEAAGFAIVKVSIDGSKVREMCLQQDRRLEGELSEATE